jgi:hypothetical protein
VDRGREGERRIGRSRNQGTDEPGRAGDEPLGIRAGLRWSARGTRAAPRRLALLRERRSPRLGGPAGRARPGRNQAGARGARSRARTRAHLPPRPVQPRCAHRRRHVRPGARVGRGLEVRAGTAPGARPRAEHRPRTPHRGPTSPTTSRPGEGSAGTSPRSSTTRAYLGAFAGQTSEEAFFVRCGSDTTTQRDIENGVVNIDVGFAPLRPAEFLEFSASAAPGPRLPTRSSTRSPPCPMLRRRCARRTPTRRAARTTR